MMGRTLEVHTNEDFYNAVGAINLTTSDDSLEKVDTVLIGPGKFEIGELVGIGVTAPLTIRGTAAQPTDTYLDARIVVQVAGTLMLENLTLVNREAEQSAVYMDSGTDLVIKNAFLSNQSATIPTVLLDGGNATIEDAVITHLDPESDVLDAINGGHFTVSRTLFQGGTVKDLATMSVDDVMVTGPLIASNYSDIVGGSVAFQQRAKEVSMINLVDGSQFNVKSVLVGAGTNQIQSQNSRVTVGTSNLDATHQVLLMADELLAHSRFPGAQVLGNLSRNGHIIDTGETATPVPPADLVGWQQRVKAYLKRESQFPDADQVPLATEVQSQAPVAPASQAAPVTSAAAATSVAETPSAMAQLDAMVGLPKLKQAVKKFINLAGYNQQRIARGMPALEASYHALFLGNPGTGKTTVARIIGKLMYEQHILPKATFVEASRQDLVAEYVGMTAPKTTKLLESALGGVLFIDEAYSLYQQGGENNYGAEAVDTMLKFMEDHRNELMIILAGYTAPMQDLMSMNPGLTSRIPNVFTFEDYTPEEIGTIGINQLMAQHFKFDQQFYRDTVTKAYQHAIDNSNGRWVRNFNEKLLAIVANNYMAAPEQRAIDRIENQDLTELTGGDQPIKDATVTKLMTQLDDLIGLAEVKTFVHDLIERRSVQQRLAGVIPEDHETSYHMCFNGNPGTGKTTVARIIAKLFYNLDMLAKDTVMEVSRTDLVGSYVGQTEQKTQQVIQEALGGVLFVDEAYELSNGQENDFGPRAIEALMAAMENYRGKLVIIFAGYEQQMATFMTTNPGLRSRVPYTLHFADDTPAEVATIVNQRLTPDWQVDSQLIAQQVSGLYRQVAPNDRSNGRWARNFAEQLVNQQQNWLADHPEVTDVTTIRDEVVLATVRQVQATLTA